MEAILNNPAAFVTLFTARTIDLAASMATLKTKNKRTVFSVPRATWKEVMESRDVPDLHFVSGCEAVEDHPGRVAVAGLAEDYGACESAFGIMAAAGMDVQFTGDLAGADCADVVIADFGRIDQAAEIDPTARRVVVIVGLGVPASDLAALRRRHPAIHFMLDPRAEAVAEFCDIILRRPSEHVKLSLSMEREYYLESRASEIRTAQIREAERLVKGRGQSLLVVA